MILISESHSPSNLSGTTRFPSVEAHSVEGLALFPPEKTMPALTFQRPGKILGSETVAVVSVCLFNLQVDFFHCFVV